MCFDFLYNFVWNISYSKEFGVKWLKMYIGLHVKYSCQVLMKLEFSQQTFDEYSNIKFH
jgi:hypothetical protein